VTGGSGFVGGALIPRLRSEGFEVRALARSEQAADRVRAAGAEAVMGDLGDVDAMTAGAAGCELAFHSASAVSYWGGWDEFLRVNVEGTRNVVAACRDAGVRRLVHVGSFNAINAGQRLKQVDETAPLRPDSKAPYCASKARAEQVVLDANGDGLEAVVIRPRLIWGPGDGTLLPTLVKRVQAGSFGWIGGGRHRTSTTQIDNIVEGLLLGARRGRPGEAYFITDGEPVVWREFVTRLLATQRLKPPRRSLPKPIARSVMAVGERLWRLFHLSGEPPLTRESVWLSANEATIDISKARSELGYRPVVTMDEGMKQLEASSAAQP
jgi:nucleoside-diphosphate-sugar epimerase